MKQAITLTVAAIILLANTAGANDLRLKHTLFGGWKYSTDGVNYAGVGMSADGLRMMMEGNQDAQDHLKAYGRNKTTGLVLGIAGGFMAGMAGAMAAEAEDDDSTPLLLLIASIPVIIGAQAAEVSATNHLLEAVRLYNNSLRDNPPSGMMGDPPGGSGLSIGFAFSLGL